VLGTFVRSELWEVFLAVNAYLVLFLDARAMHGDHVAMLEIDNQDVWLMSLSWSEITSDFTLCFGSDGHQCIASKR
jgi:hypothetical protein